MVLAVGHDVRATFYAAQRLRQMVSDGVVRGTTVSDWPLMSVRGTSEGFHDIPWSHQARLLGCATALCRRHAQRPGAQHHL